MTMSMFAVIISICAVAGYPIHRQGIQPSPNRVFSLTAFRGFSQRSSTRVFYRDEGDSFDAIRAQRPADLNIEKPSDFRNGAKRAFTRPKKRSTLRRNRETMHRPQPQSVKTAKSLEEFANIIDEGRREDKVVVAQFHASWCKKCRTLRPYFARAAISHPQIIFLNVPILNTNSKLFQGLGVESVPFGHIYHPEKGLVEETKLSRETFSEFEDLAKMHCQ